MSRPRVNPSGPAVEFHLLGQVDYDRCLALQHRLVYEAGGQNNGQINVLLCEHPPIITVGRGGSRGHIRLTPRELSSHRLAVRWISRGGGCVLHGPGQLAIYPIVPLTWHRWSIGDYMRRLSQALREVVTELGFRVHVRPGSFGIWGRTGPLAAFGVAVRYGVTCHGAFLSVNPSMGLMRMVDVVPPQFGQPRQATTMSCLLAEHGRPVRMSKVRAVVVEKLAATFQCSRYHLHTGHPLLRSDVPSKDKPRARAS